MDRRIVGAPLFTAVLLASLAFGAAGQEDSSPEMPESFNEPMPYFTIGLGPFSRTITTDSTEAQAFFDQGISAHLPLHLNGCRTLFPGGTAPRPQLCDVLLRRGLGLGAVHERSHGAGRSSTCAGGDREGLGNSLQIMRAGSSGS